MSLMLVAGSFGHRVKVVVKGTSETADRFASEIAALLASDLDATTVKVPQLVETA